MPRCNTLGAQKPPKETQAGFKAGQELVKGWSKASVACVCLGGNLLLGLLHSLSYTALAVGAQAAFTNRKLKQPAQ